MSEIPTLAQFGITNPVFIRKINNRNRWIQYDSTVEDREKKIARDVFNSRICSLWWVETDEDFYGFVASISSNRSPQNQNIDFIPILKTDLDGVGINYQCIAEGDCLAVRHLHYNAEITGAQAILLCRRLMNRNQEPQRCKKKQTQLILQYQQRKGCIAVTKNLPCQHYLCS